METDFWHKRWEKNEIRFHQSEANPILVNYFEELSLAENSRVFLPLCGKTRDIAWLLSKGCHVAGAELSEIAIEQLFEELGVEPAITEAGKHKLYSARNIDIFVGDIFNLSAETVGPVDAIYDRAALVALPEEMRNRYTVHLTELTNKSPQLLVCFEFDQAVMEGPPFSVSDEEINKLYGDSYDLSLITRLDATDELRGRCIAQANVWLLN